MTSKQMNDSGKNMPRKKVRAGRFQLSMWVFRRLLSHGDKDSTLYLEQWVDVERACIQYSTFNKVTGQWENQTLWCPLDDLRSLAAVVDQLNQEDDSSSSSSAEGSKKNEVEEDFPQPSEENPPE